MQYEDDIFMLIWFYYNKVGLTGSRLMGWSPIDVGVPLVPYLPELSVVDDRLVSLRPFL